MENNTRSCRSNRPKIISLKMDANFFFEKAMQSLDRYRYDKALKYFQRAVEYEPNNPINHCNMAGIYSEIGNYEQSNMILRKIVKDIDPTMTECYFYMANNYANMEYYEEAEEALLQYLEKDPRGVFLEESEEMIEMLSDELDRPTRIKQVKSREMFFEHDRARTMMEEGKFAEAAAVLKRLLKKYSDFTPAQNNLALACFYMGNTEECLKHIYQVLKQERGNVHALCNLAIVYKHQGQEEKLNQLVSLLERTYPFQQEHAFKLAMTLGILGRHDKAHLHFRRLIRSGEFGDDPCLHHYYAVSSFHIGMFDLAFCMWKKAARLDPHSAVPSFYLAHFNEMREHEDKHHFVSYHYYLPFEEKLRELEAKPDHDLQELLKDPLIKASFRWILYHGDQLTKMQVIQALGILGDAESEGVLRDYLKIDHEDEEMKRAAISALKAMGSQEPYPAVFNGKDVLVYASPSLKLPEWKNVWQNVLDLASSEMKERYDSGQRHDMQTLWVEFLGKIYPNVPVIHKAQGWAAALEYLTAKMYSLDISYKKLSEIYGVTVSTIRKNVLLIDDVCRLNEKMNKVFSRFQEH